MKRMPRSERDAIIADINTELRFLCEDGLRMAGGFVIGYRRGLIRRAMKNAKNNSREG